MKCNVILLVDRRPYNNSEMGFFSGNIDGPFSLKRDVAKKYYTQAEIDADLEKFWPTDGGEPENPKMRRWLPVVEDYDKTVAYAVETPESDRPKKATEKDNHAIERHMREKCKNRSR